MLGRLQHEHGLRAQERAQQIIAVALAQWRVSTAVGVPPTRTVNVSP
jgi:hypothetical protein